MISRNNDIVGTPNCLRTGSSLCSFGQIDRLVHFVHLLLVDISSNVVVKLLIVELYLWCGINGERFVDFELQAIISPVQSLEERREA